MKNYEKIEINKREWFSKVALLEIYQGLNKNSLNRFISEMRNNKEFRKGVVNPTHKLVFIH
ncbi:hypothetical protein QPJ54_000436 [Listeria monocytogenes]|nr:DNA-binding protein [Listeria monocytogenes]EHC5236744.1 DNA-binding protein [Listeria monocytogenes serotype 1/2a]EAG5667736.1 DNA-binding protein [Listeria monocytogenes]ECC2753944.1 DNA-binding protein [Listeria monocytogenes]EHC6019622.1 DNA-binding protein [Listeria monocytogenes serotype 1/2a]